MNNLDVLELIVSKLDNNTIQSLSLVPGLWEDISKFVGKQSFWFLRTEELLGRDLSWKSGEDWKEVYYILSQDRTTIDNDRDNALAASIVISLGINPSANYNQTINQASKNGHLNIVRLLLADPRVDPSCRSNCPIMQASREGHDRVVKLLLADPRVDPSDNYAIQQASQNGHVEVVRLLLADPRVDPTLGVGYAIRKARENHHTEVVKLLLAWRPRD